MRKKDYINNNTQNNNFNKYYNKNKPRKEEFNDKKILQDTQKVCDTSQYINNEDISHEQTNFTLSLLSSRRKIFKPDYKIEEIEEKELIEINSDTHHEKITINEIEKIKKTLGRFNLSFDLILYDLEFEVVFFTHRAREIFKEYETIDILAKTIGYCFTAIDYKIDSNSIYLKAKQNQLQWFGSLFKTFAIDLAKNLKKDKPELFEVYTDKLLSQLKLISNQSSLPSEERINEIKEHLRKNQKKEKLENPTNVTLKYFIFFLTRRNKPLFEDIGYRKEIIQELELYLKNSEYAESCLKYRYEFIASNSILLEIDTMPSFRLFRFTPGLKKHLSKFTNEKYSGKLKNTSMFTRSHMISNKPFSEEELKEFIEFHYGNFSSKKYL